jgi:aminoglycoside phosphotransferase family enzyme/predicted kinase
MVESQQPVLIERLQRPELFDHPVTGFEVMETHISYILLTGDVAYKIKKPVDLGFLDFSTLDKRLFFCEEELRLNRRMAPELYLGVVPITGSEDDPRVGGDGKVIEYAVKMRQFNEPDRLDHMIRAGRIKPEHIDELAQHVAEFHQRAEVATPESGYSTAERVRERVIDNFPHIDPCVDGREKEQLQHLHDWTQDSAKRLADAFTGRLAHGRVRECHGDMHLANMVLVDGEVRLFDCLEFNPQLRWIDVASDVAFAMMDLLYHDREDFAHRLWLRYLEHSGDYEALSVLRYYLVYRALVRAKVACIQRQQSYALHRRQDRDVVRHLSLATALMRQPASIPLIITHGLSGSGKTWLTERLVERTGIIRIRSDIERRRSGIDPEARYSQRNIDRVYQGLLQLAERIISFGYPVVVDATFINAGQRRQFRESAARLGAPFHILHCHAGQAVLEQRIEKREQGRPDASEATVAVLQHQLQSQEPLTADELELCVDVNTASAPDWDRIIAALQL